MLEAKLKTQATYIMQCGCKIPKEDITKCQFKDNPMKGRLFCPEHNTLVEKIICICKYCNGEILKEKDVNGQVRPGYVCDVCRSVQKRITGTNYYKNKQKALGKPYTPVGAKKPKENDDLRDDSRHNCKHYLSKCLIQYAVSDHDAVPCKGCEEYERDSGFNVDPLAMTFRQGSFADLARV